MTAFNSAGFNPAEIGQLALVVCLSVTFLAFVMFWAACAAAGRGKR